MAPNNKDIDIVSAYKLLPVSRLAVNRYDFAFSNSTSFFWSIIGVSMFVVFFFFTPVYLSNT